MALYNGIIPHLASHINALTRFSTILQGGRYWIISYNRCLYIEYCIKSAIYPVELVTIRQFI